MCSHMSVPPYPIRRQIAEILQSKRQRANYVLPHTPDGDGGNIVRLPTRMKIAFARITLPPYVYFDTHSPTYLIEMEFQIVFFYLGLRYSYIPERSNCESHIRFSRINEAFSSDVLRYNSDFDDFFLDFVFSCYFKSEQWGKNYLCCLTQQHL